MTDHNLNIARPPSGLRFFGYATALWSVGYMVPHLIFATGSDWGLAAVKPGVSGLPYWETINWLASAVLAMAALLGVAFVRLWGLQTYRWPLLVIGCFGTAIAIAHGVYGIVDRLLTVAGLKSGVPANRESWILWDLLVFEPWFVIEGLLIGATGWHFLTSSAERRQWVAVCTAGVLVAGGLALARFKVG